MNVSAENATYVFKQVQNAVTSRFKRKFARFLACDLLVSVLGLLLALLHWLLPTLVIVALGSRIVLALAVLWARADVIGSYAKLVYHRESLMRRFAHVSHMPYFAAWIAHSHLLVLLLGVVLLPIGAILLGMSLDDGPVGVASTLVTIAFVVGVMFYLGATERYAYEYGVTRTVDEVLRNNDTRRAYVVAAAALHNYRTERLFNQKNASAASVEAASKALASVGRRRRSRVARLDLETQAAGRGEAPDGEYRAQKRQ